VRSPVPVPAQCHKANQYLFLSKFKEKKGQVVSVLIKIRESLIKHIQKNPTVKTRKSTISTRKQLPEPKMSNQAIERLTSVLLDGKNYNMWARQVSFGLVGRDKLEYVNGEITKPVPRSVGALTEEENKALKDWKKNDNKVAGWLLATMEPYIAKIMTYQNTVRQMWEKAEKLYGKRKNHSHVYRLQQELHQIKQQPNQSISEIFALLQEKTDELKLYRTSKKRQNLKKLANEKNKMRYSAS
jgi:gag-polypeptide of LTR copia-type